MNYKLDEYVGRNTILPSAKALDIIAGREMETLAVQLAEVRAVMKSKYFDDAVAAKLAEEAHELADFCHAFCLAAAEPLKIAEARKTGVPLFDDGVPVKCPVGEYGEKVYGPEELAKAKEHFQAKEPARGVAMTRAEAEVYVERLTEGRVRFHLLDVASIASLGGGLLGANEIYLYFERDVWNAIRTKFRDIITVKVVTVSQQRGGRDGWQD